MDSKNFTLGMIIAAVAFAFVMINLWLWNIVPIEAMRQFDQDKTHQYLVAGVALTAMFCGGFLYAAFADRIKK